MHPINHTYIFFGGSGLGVHGKNQASPLNNHVFSAQAAREQQQCKSQAITFEPQGGAQTWTAECVKKNVIF
jgi:hypothetical protein